MRSMPFLFISCFWFLTRRTWSFIQLTVDLKRTRHKHTASYYNRKFAGSQSPLASITESENPVKVSSERAKSCGPRENLIRAAQCALQRHRRTRFRDAELTRWLRTCRNVWQGIGSWLGCLWKQWPCHRLSTSLSSFGSAGRNSDASTEFWADPASRRCL